MGGWNFEELTHLQNVSVQLTITERDGFLNPDDFIGVFTHEIEIDRAEMQQLHAAQTYGLIGDDTILGDWDPVWYQLRVHTFLELR